MFWLCQSCHEAPFRPYTCLAPAATSSTGCPHEASQFLAFKVIQTESSSHSLTHSLTECYSLTAHQRDACSRGKVVGSAQGQLSNSDVMMGLVLLWVLLSGLIITTTTMVLQQGHHQLVEGAITTTSNQGVIPGRQRTEQLWLKYCQGSLSTAKNLLGVSCGHTAWLAKKRCMHVVQAFVLQTIDWGLAPQDTPTQCHGATHLAPTHTPSPL